MELPLKYALQIHPLGLCKDQPCTGTLVSGHVSSAMVPALSPFGPHKVAPGGTGKEKCLRNGFENRFREPIKQIRWVRFRQWEDPQTKITQIF
eukprot:1154898-Prorocentrum_minimum.AAC.1